MKNLIRLIGDYGDFIGGLLIGIAINNIKIQGIMLDIMGVIGIACFFISLYFKWYLGKSENKDKNSLPDYKNAPPPPSRLRGNLSDSEIERELNQFLKDLDKKRSPCSRIDKNPSCKNVHFNPSPSFTCRGTFLTDNELKQYQEDERMDNEIQKVVKREVEKYFLTPIITLYYPIIHNVRLYIPFLYSTELNIYTLHNRETARYYNVNITKICSELYSKKIKERENL